ncbi:MAG: hypothetical protein ACOC16_01590 [Nanoarchaeota archaeon]
MEFLIYEDLELYEVLNAFPVLKESFEKLGLDISNLNEGETIYNYFKRLSFGDDEIDILVKKINYEIKHYLKNGEVPCFKSLSSEKNVLRIEEEE